MSATKTRYTRADVDTHIQGYYGPSLPAVNVKVYRGLESVDFAQVRADCGAPAEYTREWVEEHVTNTELEDWFTFACEMEWDTAEDTARDVLCNNRVKVWSEGRSGGWAVVDGLPDIDDWDAIMLARWRRFERIARLTADDVPYQMASMIYLNVFDNPNRYGC